MSTPQIVSDHTHRLVKTSTVRLRKVKLTNLPPPRKLTGPRPSKWDDILDRAMILTTPHAIEVPPTLFIDGKTYPCGSSTSPATETSASLRIIIQRRRLPLRSIIRDHKLYVAKIQDSTVESAKRSLA